ncbi:MAG: non-ribosomal peptide synthetase, partial [Chroococcidiopsidaceae cyanobacterium CP_BM_ER_R8_30]|nr:non-ribosomal peptide synthetase [Chroococcidiopsidaceae cyanobacterium CP_BM_ER_R8_30]
APSEKQLVAYVVLNQEQVATTTDLRRFLQEKLPNYMVPSGFVILEALPLTLNGKVNRHALPVPETLRPDIEVNYVMPRNETERTIANIWQKVLNLKKVGIHDNFFELGGHSLLMAQVHTQLRETLQTDISIVEMFRYPTISSLVEYFGRANNQPSSDETEAQSEKLKQGKARLKQRLEKMHSHQ